jgi:hypothetical protein
MHMAKDGKGALSFQPLLGVIRSLLWGLMEAKREAYPIVKTKKSDN